MDKISITVIILTKDEQLHIARAIDSIKKFAQEIYVVDSYSTDMTIDICQSLGAKVVKNKFVNQAQQLQWALDNLLINTEWVMRLDADEIIQPNLEFEIISKLPNLPKSVNGVVLKRTHVFMGRSIRFGGRGAVHMLRIWRNGYGKVEQRWMDEHIFVNGEVLNFDGGFLDHNLKSLSYFIEKHNHYASREAIEQILSIRGMKLENKINNFSSTSLFVSTKRIIKLKIYDRLPFTIASLLFFIWRYIFRLGFLDGRQGLVYHFLQGYWYRFLVGAKMMEMESAIEDESDFELIKIKLSELTGINITYKKIDQ